MSRIKLFSKIKVSKLCAIEDKIVAAYFDRINTRTEHCFVASFIQQMA
jgi:hypothetical protein